MELAYCPYSQKHIFAYVNIMFSMIPTKKTGNNDGQHPLSYTSRDLRQHSPALFIRMAVFLHTKHTVVRVSKEHPCGTPLKMSLKFHKSKVETRMRPKFPHCI